MVKEYIITGINSLLVEGRVEKRAMHNLCQEVASGNIGAYKAVWWG